MKAVYKVLLLSFLISNGSAAIGQKTSGYLGKRLGVQYHASVWTIPYFLFGRIEREAQGSAFGFRLSHHVEMNYVVKRKLQLGVCYQLTMLTHQPKSVYLVDSQGYSNNLFEPSRQSEFKFKFSAIGGNLRIYVGDFAAPMGNFVKLGYARASIGLAGSEGVEGKYTYYDMTAGSEVTVTKIITSDTKYAINRFHIGVGGTRPLSKRIFVDYSMGFNIHSAPDWAKYGKTGSLSSGNLIGGPTEDDYYHHSVYMAYKASDMFDICLGFGIMLF